MLGPTPAADAADGLMQTSLAEKQLQEDKFRAIVDLLLAAGYYRVRIASLSRFDKVVGGLCWCISSSGEALDVDVLFQENSSMGARIALSEQIVEALRQMACPHPLQAHQIQGGMNEADFPALLPIVMWLVKRFYETRERTAVQLRRFSTLQFGLRRYAASMALPEDARTDAFREAAKRARVQRRFKRTAALKSRTEESRVNLVLVEYGENVQDPGLAAGTRQELRDMIETKSGSVTVRGGQVVEMLTTGSELSRAATEYEARVAKTQEELSNPAAAGVASSFERQRGILKQQLKKEEAKLDAARQEAALVSGRVKQVAEAAEEQAKHRKQLEAEVRNLIRLEQGDGDHQATLKALKDLVMENEGLKAQEVAFKASCKEQRARLTAELAALKERQADPQEERLSEIEKMYEKVQSRCSRLRQVVAEKNRAVAGVRRLIDDIPTRTELIQYERRFVELYAQVTRKLEEVRKYYDMYNVLEQKRDFLDKEVKLLGSITQGFDVAMRGRQAEKSKFLDEFDGMIAGVQQQLETQQATLEARATKVDELNKQYQDLVEEERSYFKAVKDFQEECNRNEVLEAKAKRLGESLISV
mmetsp:Transcript_11676/g.43500  ORF Transcript_11676/g.43500 Transcript_11676/m.43500 type:complete len:590 (-) Transcript_11676:17-1786(-)